MKRFFTSIVLSAFLLLLPSTVKLVHSAGYGAAGCGWGSTLIEENQMLPQLGAWFLNGIFGSQTFGMTSGTSNCGPGLVDMANDNQELFIENNYLSLIKEMAGGEGENLDTLAQLFGCTPDTHAVFADFTHKNFKSIMKDDTSPEQLLVEMKNHMARDSILADSCSNIG